MLKGMRKNTKVIIWTVIASFVVWGGYSVGTTFTGEGRIAGKLFGKEISFQEYDQFYRANRIFAFSAEPSRDPEVLRNQTWQTIIYSREAKKEGIEVSDDEVRQELMRILEQSNFANPTPKQYEAWLTRNFQETPKLFESQIRELLRIQKLVRKVNAGPFESVTEAKAKEKFLLDQNKLSANFVLFSDKETAETFIESLSNSSNWNNQLEDQKLKAIKSGFINLDQWIKSHNVPEATFYALQALAIGAFSEPFPVGDKFAVFNILEKEKADEKVFDEGEKEKYLEQIREQARYQHFLQWNIDLANRSQFEDLLPKPDPLPDLPPDLTTPPPPASPEPQP